CRLTSPVMLTQDRSRCSLTLHKTKNPPDGGFFVGKDQTGVQQGLTHRRPVKGAGQRRIGLTCR
ncbi:hypothetical protein Q8F99_26885, partial [Klebsiella pneumoniae]|uniref:hypothetical protein n=1 Tax=Klebsiella pneumoniae TaxID=573 RepID=UPI002730F34D